MNTIQNTYINALLADASYVKLLKDDGTPLDGRTIRTNLRMVCISHPIECLVR